MVRLLRLVVSLWLAAGALTGCIGWAPTIGDRTSRSARGASWISPQAKNGDLLYVSDYLFTDVYVFSYPSLKVAGTLTGFSLPEGLCSDDKGDVFVTDLLARRIVEYAHGGSQPIKTLSDRGYPEGCSVDPSTGNLAVADYGSSGSPGDIAVFRHASGKPVIYTDPTMISFTSCGYDDGGDLFADGQKYDNYPGLVELPNGAGKFEDIEFKRSFDADGSVQWDGQHLAIMGNSPKEILRVAISGSKAKVIGRTTLISPRFAFAFSIQNSTLILTYVPRHMRAKDIALGLWAYPGGGKPAKTIQKLFGAYGLTVSHAQRKSSLAQSVSSKTTLVYVSDHTNNLIDVFDRAGNLQYTITQGVSAPAGLFVDAGHNLWVANPGANDVLVFPRGSMTPARTLQDTDQPNDVALCADGTAFVADSLNEGGVAVYPRGHKMPTRRLEAEQSGAGGVEFYVTCDAAGNVFATGLIGFSPFIATVGWRHGKQSGYFLLPQDAWSSSGIVAIRNGRLLIAKYDHSQPSVVEFTEAGKPTGKTIETGSDLWGDIAINAKQNVVFGADAPADAAIARTLPKGVLRRTYSSANLVQPEGVAVDDQLASRTTSMESSARLTAASICRCVGASPSNLSL
jgi:DNA-binding beta-propeller fold protein YncE